MKFISLKKIVFKNINFRLTAVLIFAVSSLAVWNWQPNTEPIQTRFLVKLQPEPETIIQNRDLSTYDFGGEIACYINNFEISVKKRELSINQARDFIFKHWENKKRAYIVLEFGGIDSLSVFHVFIEPDRNGKWHILWRQEFSDFKRGFSKNITNEEMTSVKYKVSTKEDYRYKLGTKYLVFLDKTGEEIGFL